jgi:ankyrin repeat protein
MADLNRIRELLLAAAEGDLETLSQVDPELLDVCNDEGNTLLMSSCANGKEAVVRHLLNPKFNVKIDAANVYGWTALMQVSHVILRTTTKYIHNYTTLPLPPIVRNGMITY